MYYELYVDVLFLTNFLMDYILLLLVRRILKCNATHVRVCLGAVIGAALICIIIIIPIPYAIKFVLSYFIINTLMLAVGLKIKKLHSLAKAMILLYVGTFLMGGMLGYVRQYVSFGGLLLFLSILFYYVILGIWKFGIHLQKRMRFICKVTLFCKEKKYEIMGLIDTGNCLKDTLTGAHVSVLDKEVALELFGDLPTDKIRYISYHSIGKNQGVMPLVQMDYMYVQGEEERVVEKPWFAISEEQISKTDEYQMILNPNLF